MVYRRGERPYSVAVKAIDDYGAKYRFWAAAPACPRLPQVEPSSLPHFGHRCFDSYAAFNAWKQAYLLDIARLGGVRWKK
jgi:hypothetical protein